MPTSKRLLDVGQCVPDHTAIRRLVEERFGAEVVQTHGTDDTLAALHGGEFALVLINRKLDADYSDGLEILKRIKQDDAIKHVPVMLVTNYPEYQEQSVAAGGEPGFGKAELTRPETHERLAKFLGQPQADNHRDTEARRGGRHEPK
ncbi:MAG TPA: response regulator [Pirellulales bacterium]|jgi:two-component system chemotaxis response regulator CheY|nr:response regulator [Pirellulales bacterium]